VTLAAKRMRLPVAAALALAILLAGCGGGGTTTVIDRTVTETTGSTESAPTTTEATSTEATTPAKPPAPTLHLTAFQSPSGNIGCVLLDGTARCDIVKRSWKPPPRPPGCPSEVDFGQGLEIGRRDTSGSFVCAGDTALNPEDPKLAYGSDDRSGGFLCASRSDGITCTNAAAHGFFISIQSYRAF
jgi:hypothetical protein